MFTIIDVVVAILYFYFNLPDVCIAINPDFVVKNKIRDNKLLQFQQPTARKIAAVGSVASVCKLSMLETAIIRFPKGVVTRLIRV